MSLLPERELIAAKAPWETAVLVCKKCLKRQGRDARLEGRELEDWLKRELSQYGKDRVCLLKSPCFDLCPKRGVVLAQGAELGSDKPLRVMRNGDDPAMLRRWLQAAVES